MAFVLVVGLAGIGGQVYGQDSADSDITVDVESSDVTVTLDGLWQGTGDDGTQVDLTGGDGDFTPGSDIFIRATVQTESGEDFIDTVEVDLIYEGTGAEGDAIIEYTGITLDATEDWSDSTEGTYEGTQTTDNMMRYSDPSSTAEGSGEEVWSATVTVTDTDGGTHTDVLYFNVESYSTISIDGTDNTIEGAAEPSQTIGMDSTDEGIDEEWTATDTIETFEANFEWDIEAPEPTIEDDDGNELTGFTTTYENSNGDPTTSVDSGASPAGPGANPSYELTVDAGSPPGEYSGTLSHQISINE
ncbi:MAG: hypothetical protein ACLFVL_04260 [Candidatus Aenigmatarchaeota archaeon]